MTTVYEFNKYCWVEVDDSEPKLITYFHDGTEVPAAPNYDEHSLEMALELGYGDDTWAMSRDHELAHTWLAIQMSGHHFSPVLWRVAHPEEGTLDLPWVRAEESQVLEYQKRLDKSATRPWDL